MTTKHQLTIEILAGARPIFVMRPVRPERPLTPLSRLVFGHPIYQDMRLLGDLMEEINKKLTYDQRLFRFNRSMTATAALIGAALLPAARSMCAAQTMIGLAVEKEYENARRI